MSTIDRHLGRHYGYTCQTWLARDIVKRYFRGRHRVWFATDLNPAQNGSSSNPMIIYEELQRVVRVNDFNHSRVEQLRRRLCDWISDSPSLLNETKALLKVEIRGAPVNSFRPSLWRIDLTRIQVARLGKPGQFPDEYLIRLLVRSEFEVMCR